MVTIAACQELHRHWLKALADATGGRTFSTHESEWAWMPARRQLVLMYPQRIAPAGIRPGLAEGTRLGAQSVSVWLNNAVSYAPLEAFGFRRGPQPLWMSAPVSVPQQFGSAAAVIDPEPAEVSGPDAEELAAGRGHPRTAWHVTSRGGGKLTGRAWVFVPSQQVQQEQRRLQEAAELRRQSERLATARPGRPLHQAAPADTASPIRPAKQPAGSLGGVFGLAVGPSSRRQGYGTALLSRAATVAATAGADRLAINAAPLGQELCAARGFELIGRGQQLTLDLR